MSRWNLLAPMALLLSSAPARAQNPDPAGRLASAERSVVEAIAREGLAATLSNTLARDGALLWPGAPLVVGPDSARVLLLAQRGTLDTLQLSWQPLGLELSSDAGFGITWGVALAIPPSRNVRYGRYIAAWRLSGDSWKLAAFVAIGIVPPAATVIPPELAAVHYAPLTPAGPGGPLVAADFAFARLAGDSGAALAFERFAASDGVTLGGLLNRGPAAIGRALRGGPPSHWAWYPVLVGVAASRDLGFTVGHSEIKPEGGPATYGKYLTIWRRLPGGELRFVIDGGNVRPPGS